MPRRALVLVALLSWLISSCSSTPAATPAADEPSGSQPTELAFDPDEDGAEAVPLRIALARVDSTRPDEVALVDQGAVIVADLLYDGLTEVVGLEGRLRPGLAVAWEASEELSRWEFTLDPTRIDAEAVVEHLRSLLADGAGHGTGVLERIVLVEAVDDETVAFELDGPEAGFPWLVSGLPLSVVGPDGSPTGRYVVVADRPDGLVLEPRAGLDLPSIEIVWEDTADDAYDTLTLGFVDAAVGPADALDDAASRFGMVPPARSINRFVGFDSGSPVVADDRLRAAAVAAIDRDRIVDRWPTPVFATDGLLAPTLAGYRPTSCEDWCQADPVAAARLVAEVVAETGVRPEFRVAVTGEEQRPVIDAVVEDLTSAGFSVVVEELSPDKLAAVIGRGEVDLFGFGWVAAAGSVDAVVAPLVATDSATNVFRVGSAQVDELVAEARTVADDRERWELLTEAHDLALSGGGVFPLMVAKSQWVAAPHAQDVVVRADGSLDFGPGK